MRRWIVAMVIAMAGFAVAAHGGTASTIVPAAQRYAAGSPAMRAAQSIARAHWDADPCHGRVAIAWAPQDPVVNARSSWRNPISTYGAPARNRGCRIVLNAGLRFDWPKLCSIVVHEYGHLAGHPHSHDPDDVMSAVYRRPVAACAGAAPAL
jgi:matrixin